MRPPDVLTGISPASAVFPSRDAWPPPPFLKKPRSSIAIISAIVKQSWISANCMSFGPILAILNAFSPATCVARRPVRLEREWRAIASLACALAIISTGFFVKLCAVSSGQSTRPAAPSVIGEQSNTLRGSAILFELSTVSRVISLWNWAYLFFAPCLWFLTATEAIISSVVL